MGEVEIGWKQTQDLFPCPHCAESICVTEVFGEPASENQRLREALEAARGELALAKKSGSMSLIAARIDSAYAALAHATNPEEPAPNPLPSTPQEGE